MVVKILASVLRCLSRVYDKASKSKWIQNMLVSLGFNRVIVLFGVYTVIYTKYTVIHETVGMSLSYFGLGLQVLNSRAPAQRLSARSEPCVPICSLVVPFWDYLKGF